MMDTKLRSPLLVDAFDRCHGEEIKRPLIRLISGAKMPAMIT
jgi:hypothetical protein